MLVYTLSPEDKVVPNMLKDLVRDTTQDLVNNSVLDTEVIYFISEAIVCAMWFLVDDNSKDNGKVPMESAVSLNKLDLLVAGRLHFHSVD